jgi:glycosyltransferase involved in cell wall biosynthesis
MSEPPKLPPISSAPLSVLLLAHNEAGHLESVLAAWTAQLDGLNRDYEILLVDDGSSDQTGALAESLVEKYPRLRVFRHPQHQGLGAALRTGLAEARHPLLLTVPCDEQYQPADLKLFLAPTEKDPVAEIDRNHLVAGYRVWQQPPWPLRWLGFGYRGLMRVLLNYTPERQPGWLGWRGWAWWLFARVIFGLRLPDVDCPFILFRKAIFERIPIQSQGDFALVEILAKANFLGKMMSDKPVTHRPRPRQESREEFRARRRQLWQDSRRVFSHPDFGPVVLSEPAPAPPPEPLPGGGETGAPAAGVGEPGVSATGGLQGEPGQEGAAATGGGSC